MAVDFTREIASKFLDYGGAVWNVKAFGAVGDGATDDTAAIQAAIDAAHTAGGGAVIIPDLFTALVSIQSPGAALRPYAIRLRPNVTIRGENRKTSKIKLAPATNDYNWAFFSWDYDAIEDVGGFVLENLTIDQNGPNQLETQASPARGHYLVYVGNASSEIAVRNCDFVNVDCRQGLYLTSYDTTRGVTRAVVEGNLFHVAGPSGAAVHDASIIYYNSTATDAYKGLRVAFNEFRAGDDENDVASPGASAAIETHGGVQEIVGNRCYGFGILGNITGISNPGTQGIVITNNQVYRGQSGIQIYAQPYQSLTLDFENIVCANNTFDLDPDPFVDFRPGTIYGRGVLVRADIPIRNLLIEGNVVRYRSFATVGTSGDSAGVGIYISTADWTQESKNWIIKGNIVDSPQSAGILVQGDVDGLNIIGNTVRNAGQVSAISNGFKTGIVDQAKGNAHLIACNVIYDDQATPTMVYMISNDEAASGDNISGLEIRDNVMWQAADPSTNPVLPFFITADASTDRAPLIHGAVHYWSVPSGPVRFGSRVVDNRLGAEYRQQTALESTTWTSV